MPFIDKDNSLDDFYKQWFFGLLIFDDDKQISLIRDNQGLYRVGPYFDYGGVYMNQDVYDIDNATNHVNALPTETMPDLSSFGIDLNNLDAETVKTQVKEQAKKQVQETLNNAVSEETKQSIQEAKQTVEKAKTSINKLKDVFKSDKTKQEELKQQALSKLQSKLNEVLTVPQEETQE